MPFRVFLSSQVKSKITCLFSRRAERSLGNVMPTHTLVVCFNAWNGRKSVCLSLWERLKLCGFLWQCDPFCHVNSPRDFKRWVLFTKWAVQVTVSATLILANQQFATLQSRTVKIVFFVIVVQEADPFFACIQNVFVCSFFSMNWMLTYVDKFKAALIDFLATCGQQNRL